MDFGDEDEIVERKDEEQQQEELPQEATSADPIPVMQPIPVNDAVQEIRFPQLRNQVDQGRIIGNPLDGLRTRSSTQNFFNHVAFISH